MELIETIHDGTIRTPENYPYPLWQEASRELPQRVIEQQELKVDIVSGATVTSNRFNQALQRALDN